MKLTVPISKEFVNEVRVTGDLHGRITQLVNLPKEFNKADNSLIILGDAGFNYYLDDRDYNFKKYVTDHYKFKIYCVRGNHEARPQSVPTMKSVFDPDVGGQVYYEPDFPSIKYFDDFGVYTIQEYKILVIGGAYSVDKEYRLMRGWHWFEDEMLSDKEQKAVFDLVKGRSFDFVLTHTCPITWEPTDLFLSTIDQSKVDTSMEEFLQLIEGNILYRHWLFGHFHDDRIVRENVEMYYYNNETLKEIEQRWKSYYNCFNKMDLDPKFYRSI